MLSNFGHLFQRQQALVVSQHAKTVFDELPSIGDRQELMWISRHGGSPSQVW